ncbi:MAG: serine/threonine-protein kinase [Pirellulaceae bacterium]|nr:serine/threonine-protein kinase [Pirellulaceae bacterium]
MHLNDDALRRMLRVDDTDLLVAESTDLKHLEQCDQCQKRLAELSGESPWFAGLSDEILHVHHQATESNWDESVEQLTGKWKQTKLPGEKPFWSRGPITVSIHSGDGHDTDAEVMEADVREISTDFLPPALHPELLGRLGRYDIEQLIGAGGFGIVFKAYDSELRRVVALKVLAPHLMSSGAARKRFAREAQAAAAIMHEHVIPIYDVVSQPEACYLVMQYIAGYSLQERVDRQGPLSIAEVLRVGVQISAGLQAAHQQGLVHRDVKPANILLEESVERVLISDFGLARTADDANLTRSGAITGTPHYMSPEQASGALIDVRSDLFSLGSVLYFACTGRPAFRAPQIVAVLNRICHYPHRRVSEVNPDVPGVVADLIDRLLEKDPEKRFGSALEVEQQLRQLLADWQSGTMAACLTKSTETIVNTDVATTSAPKLSVRGRFASRYWGSIALVILGLASFGAWYGGIPAASWWRWQTQSTEPTRETGSDLVATNDGSPLGSNSEDRAASLAGNEQAPPAIGYMLKLHFDSDSEPLEHEVETLLRQWRWQDEELEIWIESLKENLAKQAEK